MKTAEEVAEKIRKSLDCYVTRDGEWDTETLANACIAQALTAFREEGVNDHAARNVASMFLGYQQAKNEARAEALEEAAKFSDNFIMSDGDHGTEIAKGIRALKDKP